jgi:hypothetical protein
MCGSIEGKKFLKKLRGLLERLNKNLPTFAAVVVDNSPLRDRRRSLYPLLIPKACLTATTPIVRPSIERPICIASYGILLFQNQTNDNRITTNTCSTNYQGCALPFKMSASSTVNPTHKGSRGEVKGAYVANTGI